MCPNIDPPQTIHLSDPELGLEGWLTVDSLVNNHCSGGLRMSPNVSSGEVAKLAAGMTLKFGFLGLPHGGGKAGIVCPESEPRDRKLSLLCAFYEKAREVLGSSVYDPYPDAGTDRQDICDMLRTQKVRVPKRALVTDRSGWYTSLTVIECARIGGAARGLDLSGSTVAVEGFGKVGSEVAAGLDKLGAKVVAVSTSGGALYSEKGLDIPKLMRLFRRYEHEAINRCEEASKIEKEALLELDVDVLLPCATGHTISMANASRIRAGLISPGANFPITDDAETLLFERGTLCMPYFVANCGGTLGGTMEFAGHGRSAIVRFIGSAFREQVSSLLERSRAENKAPWKRAERIAKDRFLRMKEASERRSLRNRVFSFGMGCYREGLIPRFCMKSLSSSYFRTRISGDMSL